MERPFICGGDKYTISVTNIIALPVSLGDLPNEIEVENTRLLLKPSFHVSLVCVNQIVKKHNISISDFRDSVLKDFCEFTNINPIELVDYSDDFKFVSQNDLKTVVVMCSVSNLNKFFEFLNKKYNLKIKYPPTHVTLYALKEGKGIFLTDDSDISNLAKPIQNPIDRSL